MDAASLIALALGAGALIFAFVALLALRAQHRFNEAQLEINRLLGERITLLRERVEFEVEVAKWRS